MTASIEERCKQKNVKLTNQRKIIAQIMANSYDHPNVDELYKRVLKLIQRLVLQPFTGL